VLAYLCCLPPPPLLSQAGGGVLYAASANSSISVHLDHVTVTGNSAVASSVRI